MDNALREVLAAITIGTGASRINCRHNFTQPELHDRCRPWVTRAGAVRAGAQRGATGRGAALARAIACPRPSEEVRSVEFTHLFTDEHGDTQFESVTLAGSDVPGATEQVPTSAMTVRSSPRLTAGEGLHNCPRRQFVLVLSAVMEIETSRGECRLFRPGDVLFVEDLTGKGHRLRHLGPEEIQIMLLPVADGWSPHQATGLAPAQKAATAHPGGAR